MCLSGMGRHATYDWQAMASKLSSKTLCVLSHRLLGLLFVYSECGMYSPATPGLLNVCYYNEFASNQLGVSRSLTMVFYLYLALKTNLVQPKTLLYI